MSYTKHHTIVVTSWSEESIKAAHEFAATLFPWVSPISEAGINAVRSFFVPPDGSKEGWTDSDIGDERRNTFAAWLDTQRYEDGSSSLEWIEVSYGTDAADGDGDGDDEATIVRQGNFLKQQ